MAVTTPYNPFAPRSIEARISEILIKLEFSMICSGFDYLCMAIAETYNDPSAAEYVTKTLVPRVAKRCGKDAASVHRAMARSIDQMERIKNPKTMRIYLGSEDAPINILSIVKGVANFMQLEDKGEVIR